MDINLIVKRVAEGIAYLDAHDNSPRASQRTGAFYNPGIPSMTESVFTKNLAAWWVKTFPKDIDLGYSLITEHPYPKSHGRGNCDLAIIDKDSQALWAIEVKRIQFVGDNGKNNDFGLAKVLSPYNKDRSVVHDVLRLRDSKLAANSVVVSYGFEYSFKSCDEALLRHPNEHERISNVRDVCKKENSTTGTYPLNPMLDMLNDYLVGKKLTQGKVSIDFENVWRHPCGGNGKVAGWKVNPLN
jgi:hypothetical protein